MKTYLPKENEFNRKAYLIDANGKTLGRLATRVACLLIGKGKKVYTPHMLCGDQVVVINAAKVFVTGKKKTDKIYTHYTGFPGGLREYAYEDLIAKKPTEIITRAVARMIPNTRLGKRMLRRLRVFAGDKHNQQSLKPISVSL
ncbi:MAG: 50S ribosomal protein L13 [Candidatus Omnitrophica bacterium]|nr:50S ribosomal protein L13 [Candidatus Omnitrophota bacterium]